MALSSKFPKSPYDILDPSIRWTPTDGHKENLMPPLVAKLREKVKEFRDSNYEGATETSRSLLNWWFKTPHLLPQADGVSDHFRYFFAQREAVETVIYLYDVFKARDSLDLMRFDSSGRVSTGMFKENWRRYVIKMATGTGKTKVLSLVIAWSYYHKLYEENSELARNFLVIAPNIIVLDRLYKDFKGLDIFSADPVLPDNGFDGRNWRDDFQLTLHLQDEVRVVRPTGNIFLTNIHRVYAGNDIPPSPDDADTTDYFLGKRPTGATTDSKVDLGMIVRDIEELAVLNDEAHHIHNDKMAWFKSIEDIHNRLVQKGAKLSLQVDVTATPKHNNGAIFVQTISDYPLVEAIAQNVVKHPTLPDKESREKLSVRKNPKYTEKYADYLELGVVEWRKAYEVHDKVGKKSILFVMTDDTKNCDEVAEYLEATCPDLKGKVLVIHTNNNGEISESVSPKKKKELEKLRKSANEIDNFGSPFKAVVSVLMLKEGWDVRNVTTIVGLRAYRAASNILPEQTLGRGLRKMYSEDDTELLSVVGTDAFMDFVESIREEGVELEYVPMGSGTIAKAPFVIEVDRDKSEETLEILDIKIPILTPRAFREYKDLTDLRVDNLIDAPVEYKKFSEEGLREIVFRYMATEEVTHRTLLGPAGDMDYRSVIAFFAQTIMNSLRLVSGYDVLYGKVKEFIQNHLFGEKVDLENANTLRNLSEPSTTKTVIEAFIKGINGLTVKDEGGAEIRETIRLTHTRPFHAKRREYIVPKISVFNLIVGDSPLELDFAKFLEGCPDVVSYTKNYLAIGFKIDYVNTAGGIANYYPDFVVKLTDGRIFVVETKGLVDIETPLKMKRLKQWCADVNSAQSEAVFDFVFVDEKGFRTYRPKTFGDLIEGFREYKS